MEGEGVDTLHFDGYWLLVVGTAATGAGEISSVGEAEGGVSVLVPLARAAAKEKKLPRSLSLKAADR